MTSKKHSLNPIIVLVLAGVGVVLVMGPIPQPSITCNKLICVVEAYFNGSTTIGDAAGDTATFNAGTINLVNNTTIDGSGKTISLKGAWGMGDDAYFTRDVNAGLTASITQSQGQGALTAEVNEVATCANDNDTVTLPSAATGMWVTVINNGAKTLQIFPASGDDLGQGVDTSTTLATGTNTIFQAYDVTNWEELW
jgi:hypothetical protein